jgi:hypothetical protein
MSTDKTYKSNNIGDADATDIDNIYIEATDIQVVATRVSEVVISSAG